MSDTHIQIIATMGPAIRSKEVISKLIKAGVSVFRLNFSHADLDDQLFTANMIREVDHDLGTKTLIMQDLQGPSIRVGEMEGEVHLSEGEKLKITTDDNLGTSEVISTNWLELPKQVKIGETILIDDGKIELLIQDIKGNEVITKIVHGGLLRSKKSIHLPFSDLRISAVTQKDLQDLQFAIDNNLAEWVAISGVRNRDDLLQVRELVNGKNIKVAAKIETAAAVQNFDEIIVDSDLIFFARVDLSVEIPIEELPFVQKRIFKKCNDLNVPIICATQFVESNQSSPVLSRMETFDVANAILDGANYMLLAAETSVGQFPIELTRNMRSIILSSQNFSKNRGKVFRINVPKRFRTMITQYLNFFNDFIRNSKNEEVELNINSYEDGLELHFSKTTGDAWLQHFSEYIALVGANIDDIKINYTKEVSVEENQILILRLRNELRQLKTKLEMTELELLIYKKELIPTFKKILDDVGERSQTINVQLINQVHHYQLKDDIDLLKILAMDIEGYVKNIFDEEFAKEIEKYIKDLEQVSDDSSAKKKLPKLFKFLEKLNKQLKLATDLGKNITKAADFLDKSKKVLFELAEKLNFDFGRFFD